MTLMALMLALLGLVLAGVLVVGSGLYLADRICPGDRPIPAYALRRKRGPTQRTYKWRIHP